MKKALCLFAVTFFFLMSAFSTVYGKEILVNTERGACVLLEVYPDDTLADVVHETQAVLGKHGAKYLWIELSLDDEFQPEPIFWWKWEMKKHGQYLGRPRDYYAPLTDDQFASLQYIIRFLANRSLLSIAGHRGTLEDHGTVIDPLHPFVFLKTVFTDEELKVGIRNIRGKGWVWGDFVAGIKESLNTEANIGNINESIFLDFCKCINLDPNLLFPLMKDRRWDEFIDTLITRIPRRGDHQRYGQS